jgi:serine/threonine-protein kinase
MQAGTFITPQLRLVRLIGQGGMGSVWLADHVSLCTQVVVKFCQGDLAARRSAVERFQREAALAAQAKGPHVVQVYDFGQTNDGVPYIAMESLVGEDLGKRLRRDGRVSPIEFANWLEQIAKGLNKAHRAGVVHRDIKPENLYLCAEPEGVLVKVLDFGVAKGGVDDAGPRMSDTKTGALLGTLFYMSPEQVSSAKQVDARADLWSLAVVTYFALTGKRPFDGAALAPVVKAIRQGKYAAASSVVPDLPNPVDVWMRKALAVNPEQRFQTAQEMAAAFRVAIGGAPLAVVSSKPLATSARLHTGARSIALRVGLVAAAPVAVAVYIWFALARSANVRDADSVATVRSISATSDVSAAGATPATLAATATRREGVTSGSSPSQLTAPPVSSSVGSALTPLLSATSAPSGLRSFRAQGSSTDASKVWPAQHPGKSRPEVAPPAASGRGRRPELRPPNPGFSRM